MKTIARVGVTLGLLLALAGCGRESTQEKQANACASLRQLNSAVTQMKALNKDSTMDQVRAATQEVQRTASQAEKDLKSLRSDKVNLLKGQVNNLSKAVHDIPSTDTVAMGVASIQDEIAGVKAATVNIAAGTSCDL